MVAFETMRQKGLLIPDVNPFIQLALMYPIAQWSSTISDLDHHWESTPNKSPVNRVVHFLLHLTRPKHRSWQTHSILFTGSLLFLLYTLVMLGDKFFIDSTLSNTDWIIVRILTIGFITGFASHLFSDFLNPSGIHLYPGYKIRAVPKTSFFATGGPWETKIYAPLCLLISAVVTINIILGLFNADLSIWNMANQAYTEIKNTP